MSCRGSSAGRSTVGRQRGDADRPPSRSSQQDMIVFLLALEIGLRLVTDGSHVLIAAIRRRGGIESDLGVWKSLWAAVRRPLGPDGGDASARVVASLDPETVEEART
jgi:hypothetical protein